MIVPSVDLVTVRAVAARPLVVAIAHIPILVVVVCAIPIWIVGWWRPTTHGNLAIRLLRELSTWSRDVIGAAYGAQPR